MTNRVEPLPFDLRSLETFLAVCDAGSMAAAARALGMTQPAVSQAVAELEARTGTTLFDRTVRPLALTPQGGVLRQRGAALLSEARQIGPLLKETTRGRFALLRAGLVDSLARALSAPIASFLSGHADQVSIFSGLTAAHAGALLTRHLDLFIGVDDLVEIAGLERIELVTEPYVLIVPSGVPPPKTAAELAQLAKEMAFIRYSSRSKTGVEIERHLRRSGLEFASGPEFDTPFGATSLVARGEGFAITTPLCLAEANLPAAAVAVAPLPGAQLRRTLTLVARAQELGALPRRLATACRESLVAETLPKLYGEMPWLNGSISI